MGTKRKGAYECIKECGQNFDTERGLGRHQASCKTLSKIRAADLAEAHANREKRRRLDELEPARPSSLAIATQVPEQLEGISTSSSKQLQEQASLVCADSADNENDINMDVILHECGQSEVHPPPAGDSVNSGPSRNPLPTPETLFVPTLSTLEPPQVAPESNIHHHGEGEALGRGKRVKKPVQRYVPPRTRRPRRYNDVQPSPPAPIPDVIAGPQSTTEDKSLCTTEAFTWQPCETERNAHGLFREYFARPSYVPDELVSVELDEVGDIHDSDAPGPQDDSSASTRIPDNNDLDRTGSVPPQVLDAVSQVHIAAASDRPWFWPFLNATTYRLMNWFWTGSQQKSVADLQTLVHSVIQANDFNAEDLRKFSAKKESERLDNVHKASSSPNIQVDARGSGYDKQDGWREVSVSISLPDRRTHKSDAEATRFSISGLFYRPLVAVIKTAFEGKNSLRYHYMPYKQFWSPGPVFQVEGQEVGPGGAPVTQFKFQMPAQHGKAQRIWGELYTSEAWLIEHRKIQQKRNPSDAYENAIAGLMFWSDSTHLAQFGSASLWPVYLYFGNQSKYERSRPTAHACHHVAYLPELPDSISEAFRKASSEMKKPSEATLGHCRHELMHALLAVLCDEEFKTAYGEGLVIKCGDGVTRRIFPRIFTWSADYPEKVILSSIRYLSDCPCPRCLVPKVQTHELGIDRNAQAIINTKRVDSEERRSAVLSARDFIYRLGRGVKSVAVMTLLGARSLVPTINTLSAFLSAFNQNFYSIFVSDLMHEFELGVWKTIFIQLIQIISDGVPNGLSRLNERYRTVPPFGSGVIRRFNNDASAMKQLGARDFEDLLLCAMPVFEGLLPPEHDVIVMDLLFCLLTWHALAKLRLHTDATIVLLEHATRKLGSQLRLFKERTCDAYEKEELKKLRVAKERKDAARRKGKKAKTAKASGNERPHDQLASEPGARQKSTKKKCKRRRIYNLNTYKTHALGHYTEDIRMFGTLDSYSTQSGELEHRQVKKFYSRTNKNNYTLQITRIERRDHLLRDITADNPNVTQKRQDDTEDYIPFTQSDRHYHISSSRRTHIFLPAWLREHEGDPAIVDFRNKLKDHLLRRLLNKDFDGDEEEYSREQRNTVQIEYERLYIHKVIRVNHTTYDLRRNQDSMNPRSHSDVMVLAPQLVNRADADGDEDFSDEQHPFWYARIIGIFHANIRHAGPQSRSQSIPQSMEFLWVRWYGYASEMPSGWEVKRLHAVKFVPKWDAGAFGFIDPSQVVRGIHLIPAFHYGRALARLTNSLGCRPDEEEWECYYVNSFVDRDVFMRYAGGGVGHTQIDMDSNFRPLRTADLQPRADEVVPEITEIIRNLASMPVDEEQDEVLSVHEDGEDDDDSSFNSDSDDAEFQ